MSKFTPEEITYLQSQRLVRMATVDAKGDLHVVPVSFRYNPDEDTIDIGGHGFTTSKKYRDALRHGRIAVVADDAAPAGGPRFIEVRGTVRAEPTGGEKIRPNCPPEILRLTPTYIVSLGVDDGVVNPAGGQVQFHGRKVE